MVSSKESQSLEDRLIHLYKEVLREPKFENYEANVGEIDALFSQLQQRGNIQHDRGKLIEIKTLHEQIVSMILSEKEGLGEEFTKFNRKKNASSQYGKVSDYERMDAFFVDYKK
ncbi:hypothetical protein [Paenibacillus sp. FSL R5-0810]|uniref:hypothetical protein n=1 Tax=Paenibacillus sp. FSL R5-0810 TaxID=2921659 RepID=UPI0030F56618